MGQRGPKATPTAILKLRGSKPRSRPPSARRSRSLRAPADLDPEARAIWKRVVKAAGRLGTVTENDVETLARYCRLRALWDRCVAHVEKYGPAYPIKGSDGQVKCFGQFVQVGVMNRISPELLKIEREFGLTPAARAALRVEEPTDGEPEVAARNRTAS